MFTSFVWHGKPPHLSYDLMRRAKVTGRLCLLDLSLYYQANVLMHVGNWNLHTLDKLCVPLQKTMAGRNVEHAPWLPCTYRGVADPLLSQATLAIWDRLNAKYALAKPHFPLSPLGGFPWFLPGEQLAFFNSWGKGVGNPLIPVHTWLKAKTLIHDYTGVGY